MSPTPIRPLTHIDQPRIDQTTAYLDSLTSDIREADYGIVSYYGSPDEGLYTTAFTVGRNTELIVFGMPPEVGSSLLRDLCSHHAESLAHGSEIEGMIAFGEQVESVALRRIAPVALMGYAPVLATVRKLSGLSPAPTGALQVLMRDEFGVSATARNDYQPDLSPLH